MTAEHPYLYLSPAMQFGRPNIGGSRLPAEVVAQAWWDGSSEVEIYYAWPDCKGRGELLLACWWMARYGTRLWRKRWGRWLKGVERSLWDEDYSAPLPPQWQEGKDG